MLPSDIALQSISAHFSEHPTVKVSLAYPVPGELPVLVLHVDGPILPALLAELPKIWALCSNDLKLGGLFLGASLFVASDFL
jgi:hypothetical protein